MKFNKMLPALLAILLSPCLPAGAQLTPAEPDPLARIRDAAAANVQACSATGETLCEQVAPKIIANAQGDSPLAENLRLLRKNLATRNKFVQEGRAVEWAMAAFRETGLDPHIEKYANPNGSAGEQQNVVAEYRGRDNSNEWVLVGAHLAPRSNGSSAVENICDAASVIEAARDIALTAMHPKRSIRFVLFTGDERDMLGSWAYVRSHRAELDHARAAIIFHSNCYRVSGYSLNGGLDIEAGLRDAMKPIESLGATHFVTGAKTGTDDFDFLLEGVPTLSAYPILMPVSVDSPMLLPNSGKTELADLKHNVAVVAVTAFGIAERTEPIGPRQSHAEIELLLETFGLEFQMKTAGTWKQWESGERGRLP
ncbi:MAG TPA: M28 family peptidase [Candidatus Acidoferrales bacterium]|nr:M28 family peptidase [Candidatus Acidoferrales bacterium]